MNLLIQRGLRPESIPHGMRSRYVSGCRCAPCTAANTAQYHRRQEKAAALAHEINAPIVPTRRVWIAADGTPRFRVFKRSCPGIQGKACRWRSYLRKDSLGGVCRRCRYFLVWDGLVPAIRARKHLKALSRLGVGRRSVAQSCDVSETVIFAIKAGTKAKIRASTERRILGRRRVTARNAARVERLLAQIELGA